LVLKWTFGCEPTTSSYPPEAPLWRDPDRRPFNAQLKPQYFPHDWDRIEKTFLLPVTDTLSVRPPTEATNVNALDEVPDSSWFENRVSRFPMTPEDAGRGPCRLPLAAEAGPWRVVSAKPDGATPGFVFEAPGGQRYLAKVDGASGSPRASLADVLGSRIYHAAGYRVPCNSIAYFDASMLIVDPGARAEDEVGKKVPLTEAHLARILRSSLRRKDGLYRSVVSQYLDGRPLGPWRYHGRRAGDRNDIVRHEERRELRGARLLAAWTDHVDQREGNTLAMWRQTEGGRGYVMHHLLDFGDCFGSVWGGSAQEAWRRGHEYWIDPGRIIVDWLTLGSIERPWDRAALGSFGLTLGYYGVEDFDPEGWRPRYPNPAFSRMTEHDGAWMARNIARLGENLLEPMLDAADVPPPLRAELTRILIGRRRRILERYLRHLSPLADATVRHEGARSWLCAVDLAVRAGVAHPRGYRARIVTDTGAQSTLPVRSTTLDETCVLLPRAAGAADSNPQRVRVTLDLASSAAEPKPIHFQLSARRGQRFRVVGIERFGS
jgi:hypothetical protein